MRILVVTNIYPTAERPFMSPFVKEQVESLREQFPELTVDVHVIKGLRPRAEYLRDMVRLPSIVKTGQYDAVHAHFGLTLVSTIFVGAPVVITFHGTDLLANPTKHVSRLLAPKARKVIVVSQKLKEVLGYGEVIPCGIDAANFALPLYHSEWHYPKTPGKLKVLFPANPTNRVKNYPFFQLVCRELEARGYNIEEVHLVNIARAKVREIYWDCDLMFLTSHSEGSPTVIKEAIASKLPFVSLDVGDVQEWVKLVDFGVVATGRNPASMADAAISLLSKVQCRASLDNSKCVEIMNLPDIARRVHSIYDQVTDNE